MTYPFAIVSEFNDMDGEPDNGSFYVCLQLKQSDDNYAGDFDFCFNSGIGKLLGFSFHALAMSNGAYYRRGGCGLDYFFKSQKMAVTTAQEVNDIVLAIKTDESKVSKTIDTYRHLMEEQAQKLYNQGYKNDCIRVLESIPQYIESFLA